MNRRTFLAGVAAVALTVAAPATSDAAQSLSSPETEDDEPPPHAAGQLGLPFAACLALGTLGAAWASRFTPETEPTGTQ